MGTGSAVFIGCWAFAVLASTLAVAASTNQDQMTSQVMKARRLLQVRTDRNARHPRDLTSSS